MRGAGSTSSRWSASESANGGWPPHQNARK
nr:MAG TPA: hypothetical protein [Caudoviricetes sp.]